VATFTKYDILVDSLKPHAPDEDKFYEDTEKQIENLGKEDGPIMGSIAGTSASQIDPDVSRAEEKFCEMITSFEEMFSVPWVKVSGLHILPFILSARSN